MAVNCSPQCTDAARLKQKGRPAMERLASPTLRKSPEDMAVGNNQHIAVDAFRLSFAHDGSVPFLPDLLNEPIKAFGDIGRAPVFRLDPRSRGEERRRVATHSPPGQPSLQMSQ